ncbi:MAG: hypothetical protein C0170_08445 [Hydrogenobaculum sp.]|nr:MAG: hypothetical protein C0170_08445 [Hydrogenobaculum sp.]
MDKIIGVKQQELNLKLSELNRVKYEINDLEIKKKDIENAMDLLNKDVSTYEEYIANLVAYQKLYTRLKAIEKTLNELKLLEEALAEEAKDIVRDIKAMEIIKHNRLIEHMKKELYKEEMDASFFYNLKHFYIVLITLFLAFNIKTFGAPALYQNAENQINQAINQDQQNLNMLLDQKLKKLEQQKKELQALIKKQEELQKLEKKKQEEAKKKKQQEEQEIQKYVKVVAAADSDQAGAMLNDVDPEIAAKILVMLPSRKAGSILSAMDPKKAALVTDYIMTHKKELNAMKKEIMNAKNQPQNQNTQQNTPNQNQPQNSPPPPPG